MVMINLRMHNLKELNFLKEHYTQEVRRAKGEMPKAAHKDTLDKVEAEIALRQRNGGEISKMRRQA